MSVQSQRPISWQELEDEKWEHHCSTEEMKHKANKTYHSMTLADC